MNHTHGKIISTLTFFENKSWNFVWMTVPLLKQVNFALYEIIYREGDISNECKQPWDLGYFIQSGQVAFCTPEGIPFRNLMKGMTFGDISLLNLVGPIHGRNLGTKQQSQSRPVNCWRSLNLTSIAFSLSSPKKQTTSYWNPVGRKNIFRKAERRLKHSKDPFSENCWRWGRPGLTMSQLTAHGWWSQGDPSSKRIQMCFKSVQLLLLLKLKRNNWKDERSRDLKESQS